MHVSENHRDNVETARAPWYSSATAAVLHSHQHAAVSAADVTTDEFQLAYYTCNDRERVFGFVREAFPAAAAARLIQQWEWKYDKNPFNQGGTPHIMLLQARDKLVAMYGRIFFRVVIDGTEHVAHHGCDLVVHPAYRGRRLSARLRDRDAIESPLHFSWQNEATYRVARRDGSAGVPFVPLVRPLDLARVVRRAVGDHWFGRFLGAVGGRVERLVLRRPRDVAEPGVVVRRVGAFDEQFDRLWQRARRDHRIMVVRDRRYLEWRFTQRPDARYTILVATSGSEVVGYMVTRCVDHGEERRGYLVDFLVQHKSPRVFGALLEHAVEHLRRDGAMAIVCRVTVPPYRRMLYRHGFVRPLRARPGYVRARTRLPDRSGSVESDARQWFLTMGDGDLELAV